MKKIYYIMAAVLVVLSLTSLAATPASDNRNFGAHLTGDEEVPARETLAQGQATFQLDKTSYEPGETIVASWTGSTSATDWIGIYPRGVVPDEAMPSTKSSGPTPRAAISRAPSSGWSSAPSCARTSAS